MATVAAKTTQVPRYGAPAEVAALLGLSTKTLRRLIASGTVPSYRVGRRVLVAYRDADQFIRSRRAQPMAVASPSASVDARGRALPLTAEEIRRRNAEAIRALDELAAIGDEDEQRATLDALMTALDEDRLPGRTRSL